MHPPFADQSAIINPTIPIGRPVGEISEEKGKTALAKVTPSRVFFFGLILIRTDATFVIHMPGKKELTMLMIFSDCTASQIQDCRCYHLLLSININ